MKTEVAAIPGKISLTMDGWSTKNLLPFTAIRGHWLNEKWEYCSKLFDFTEVIGDHSGENQSHMLPDCLSRLGIPFEKTLAITVDNASNNDTLFAFLIKDYGLSDEAEHHVRCLAHILNLCVQDILHALKVPESISFDEDLEEEVRIFKSSQSLKLSPFPHATFRHVSLLLPPTATTSFLNAPYRNIWING